MTPTEIHLWLIAGGTTAITFILMLLVSYAVAVIRRRRDE